jgi:hypothetical protein
MPEPPRRRKKTYSVDSLNSLDSFFWTRWTLWR